MAVQYGKIEFEKKRIRKFAVVDDHISSEGLAQILTKIWKLKKPNLLISVTDEGGKFNMGSKRNAELQWHLRKIINKTDVCFLTEGTNTDVGRFIGKAVRDSQTKGFVYNIGITNIEAIYLNEKFTDQRKTILYKSEKDNRTSLNPNHSHFILVKSSRSDGVFQVRDKIEECMRTMSTPIPMFLLVLQGGRNTFDRIKDAKIPICVVSGAGVLADQLADANQKRKTGPAEDSSHKTGNDDDEVDATVIQEFMSENSKPIIIHQHSDNCGTESFEEDILTCLLEATKDKLLLLSFALDLGNRDFAKSHIFTENRTWDEEQMKRLYRLAFFALKQNKVDFVELFFDRYLNVKQLFNTKDFLSDLYKQTKCDVFKSIKDKQTRKVLILINSYDHLRTRHGYPSYIYDVWLVLQSLIGDFYCRRHYLEYDGNFAEQPLKDLFLWSVLMNREEMAIYFWKKNKNKVYNGLEAHFILESMAARTSDKTAATAIKQMAKTFNDLAIGVLHECYCENVQKAHDLLLSDLPDCEGVSCIDFAFDASNKLFFSQQPCIASVTTLWLGSLSIETGFFQVFMSILFPPLILTIKFTDGPEVPEVTKVPQYTCTNATCELLKIPNEDLDRTNDPNSRKEPFSPCSKVVAFYNAPVTRFVIHLLSQWIFMTLFAYLLLINLSKDFTWLDYVLITWVTVIVVEECRQVISSPSISVRNKVASYFRSMWNVFDVFSVGEFTFAMLLRLVPYEEAMNVSRIVFGFSFMMFTQRTLQLFFISNQLGAKMLMIWEMSVQLVYFAIILMVFVVGYGVGSYTMIYPNSEADIHLILRILKTAYFNLYGDLFIENYELNVPDCTNNPLLYNNDTLPRCPSAVGVYAGPIMTGIYVLFGNVLLLNVVIAMFSFIFQNIQRKQEMHSHYQRYSLINEYRTRPPMFPPLTITSLILRLRKWISNGNTRTKAQTSDQYHSMYVLRKWENAVADIYLRKKGKKNKKIKTTRALSNARQT